MIFSVIKQYDLNLDFIKYYNNISKNNFYKL